MGYWTGKLKVPQDGVYEFMTQLSWSEARVMLDKHIIIKGQNNNAFENVYLKAGTYQLEVEYRNNWYTTNFQATAVPYVQELDEDAMRNELKALNLPADTVIYGASVYESDSKDNHITIQTPAESRPYILVLSSYNPVNWEVVGNNMPKVVIYAKNTTVQTSSSTKVLVATYTGPYYDNLKKRSSSCTCVNGAYVCTESDQSQTDMPGEIQTRFGFPLVGFAGEYSTNVLSPKLTDSAICQ
ncbi:PA14 domain-containing protein [Neisseriaceae bacterium B1]